ncbi:MAG: hypothetical protein JW829_11555 [Pirellulales bacterium]|nr:hypothetical protein [Pirellulales bacterium]
MWHLKTKYPRLYGRPIRWLACCILLTSIILTFAVLAQDRVPLPSGIASEQQTEEKFSAYPLVYVSGIEIESQIRGFLKAAEPGAEVLIDANGNRVLVRGNPRSHALVQQLLSKLDRPPAVPANPPQATAQEPPAQMQAYPLPANSELFVHALKQRYQGRPDTRIAMDNRTAQLLVFAPDHIHAEIKNLLAKPVAGEASSMKQTVANRLEPIASTPSITPSPSPLGQQEIPPDAHPEGITIQLRNLDVDTVRSQLERLLRRPMAVTTQPGSSTIQFTLEAVPGSRVFVEADRQMGIMQLSGRTALSESWAQVIRALDISADRGIVTELVSTRNVPREQIRQVTTTLAAQQGRSNTTSPLGNTIQLIQPNRRASTPLLAQNAAAPSGSTNQPPPNENQPPLDATPPVEDRNQPPSEQVPSEGIPPEDAPAAANPEEASTGLIGPVQITFVEGLDILVVQGEERDVQRVMAIINQIEQLTKVTEPRIEVLPLVHVQSEAMATLIAAVYQQVLAARQGDVSITPLVKPNALLLIGRPENVDSVIALIEKLDQPVDADKEFEVFPLKHASAVEAKTVIDGFFGVEEGAQAEPQGLAPRVLTTADFRSNALIVRASPRDMLEVRALVRRLDTDKIDAVNEVRVFQLRNALAEELAPVLQDAIAAQGAGQQPGQPPAGQQAGGTQQTQRSAMLRFVTIDAEGMRKLESGVLTDVRINADARSNALVVTSPAESMELIAALIHQLDRIPSAEAQLKVFTIANGDAAALVEMLETLIGDTQQQQQGPALGGLGGGGDSLVQLRFSVDQRTNSIIAAGTMDDLAVVEAVLLRLDESDIRERENLVFHLKNAPAEDVATALNEMLTSEREIQQIAPDILSPYEQIEREVVIVPEPVSNTLIVSTTKRYFDKVKRLIEQLDEQPPMVMIQVLIAEVSLNDTDQFGVELGLQDSVLFDRSLLEILDTTTTTTTTQEGGTTVTVSDETIQSATISPGFDFANPNTGLGNTGSDLALAKAGKVAAQALSSFALGRIDSELGYGGFVFSASSESVSVLLRALQESRRLEVLSRPQVMAIDNQFAAVQVGQRVPVIRSAQVNETGQVNTVDFEDVGLIIRVQPRVNPDGLVVMQIETENSKVGPEAEGIPVSISSTGQVVRSPRIDIVAASTTVHALSGQTVVLGGLITKKTSDIHRRVPLLADIPLLGDLFRYDAISESRTELLIIMTPRIVKNKLDAELIKQVESARMNWVLCDVIDLHGPSGLRSRSDDWSNEETQTFYPTLVPEEIELTPTPAKLPGVESAPNSIQRPVTPSSYEQPIPLPPVSQLP